MVPKKNQRHIQSIVNLIIIALLTFAINAIVRFPSIFNKFKF